MVGIFNSIISETIPKLFDSIIGMADPNDQLEVIFILLKLALYSELSAAEAR